MIAHPFHKIQYFYNFFKFFLKKLSWKSASNKTGSSGEGIVLVAYFRITRTGSVLFFFRIHKKTFKSNVHYAILDNSIVFTQKEVGIPERNSIFSFVVPTGIDDIPDFIFHLNIIPGVSSTLQTVPIFRSNIVCTFLCLFCVNCRSKNLKLKNTKIDLKK